MRGRGRSISDAVQGGRNARCGALALAVTLGLGTGAAALHAAPAPDRVPAKEAKVAAGRPLYMGSAPVAYLIDATSGAVLFERNGGKRFAPASMTKVMTVYVALDMVRRGEARLDQVTIVAPETWKRWRARPSASTLYLHADERISVRDLIHGVVTVSGNDAAETLARALGGDGGEAAFIVRMNRTAQRIGMSDSRFGSVTGWPDGGATQVTARDLARLADRLVTDFPEEYVAFFGRKSLQRGKLTLPNHNPLLGHVAGADGIKTGHTGEAGYCLLGSAERDGRRLVAVVANLPTAAARAKEARALIEWGFSAWDTRRARPKAGTLGSLPVSGGDRSRAAVRLDRPLHVSLVAGSEPSVDARLIVRAPVAAPASAGTPIGRLEVRVEGLPPQSIPVLLNEPVVSGGIFDRMRDGLMRFAA